MYEVYLIEYLLRFVLYHETIFNFNFTVFLLYGIDISYKENSRSL
jgi:hypothetical protein